MKSIAAMLMSVLLLSSVCLGEEEVSLKGVWNHNSYLIEPTPAQFDANPLGATERIEVESYKWAKGKFTVEKDDSKTGTLEFMTGLELSVTFSIVSADGRLLFTAVGKGEKPPLAGVEYRLTGWVTKGDNGEVSEISGGILGVKAADDVPHLGLMDQKPGTIGYFRLSK